MTTPRTNQSEQGMFLFDITLAMVIIAIALGAVVMVFRSALVHSADPLIIDQNVAIARSYLEEILAQPYCEPANYAAGPPATCSTVCPAPEAGRNLYDNVCDYDNLSDTGVKARDGSSVTGLENFNVTVDVVPAPTDKLGPVGAYSLDAETLRVNVTVGYGPSNHFPVTLSGYRTLYGVR